MPTSSADRGAFSPAAEQAQETHPPTPRVEWVVELNSRRVVRRQPSAKAS